MKGTGECPWLWWHLGKRNEAVVAAETILSTHTHKQCEREGTPVLNEL